MVNSSQSGIARFLKFSGIVQVISMIIVAVFIASAYFIYKADFRGWDRLENSYLGTPEPLTSMVFFMFGLAALWFMMPIKIYLGRLPLTHVSKARKTLTFITILGLCIVATVVAVFAELIGLMGAAIAADWAGGIFVFGRISVRPSYFGCDHRSCSPCNLHDSLAEHCHPS